MALHFCLFTLTFFLRATHPLAIAGGTDLGCCTKSDLMQILLLISFLFFPQHMLERFFQLWMLENEACLFQLRRLDALAGE